MSWLLVALIPGLLMLATIGLGRVESNLHRDAISATEAAEFLSLNEQDPPPSELVEYIPTSDSLTHQYIYDSGNPEFQQTRQMNPV